VAIHSILVVDDNQDTLQVMRQVLESQGYAVSVADDGKKAIRVLLRDSADLVITDMLMPHGDGFELITALHRDFPALPVIAMSGGGHLAAETYLGLARGFRVNGILRKPVTRDELSLAIKAVENHLQSSSMPNRP
jgi:CheY-like chemotaxis protein